jgi:hypothetical protein
MTVGDVLAAKPVIATGPRGDRPPPAPGDKVELRVLQQLDEHRYLISLRGAQHVVSSMVPLTVGSTVRAVVTAVGEKLELRYVGEERAASVEKEQLEAQVDDSIVEHAQRYAVNLQAPQRTTIEHAMREVAEPQAMLAGGLFLGKLGLEVESANLHALYSAQKWQATTIDTTTVTDASQIASPATPALLAEQMLAVLQDGASRPGAPERDERGRARRLLNEPDDSSVSYRYGVLPVLIADQLVELDVVHFRERRRDDGAAGNRRLVMTFSTSNLGRVEVVARALSERLAIFIATDSPQARDLLAAGASDVRALAQRLGWNVESVSYEVAADTNRAARHVIDHVLNGDTLSALV